LFIIKAFFYYVNIFLNFRGSLLAFDAGANLINEQLQRR